MSNDIKYTEGVKDLGIDKAMKSGASALVAERKGSRANEVVWNQTVISTMCLLDGDEEWNRGANKKAITENREVLKGLMAAHILDTTTIPEKGTDKKGKSNWDVCDAEGMPKWSSWQESVRIFDYIGSIAKVFAFSKDDLLMPEEGKVAGRCSILAECKVIASPLENVTRLCKDLQTNLDNIEVHEATDAYAQTNALMVNNLEITHELSNLVAKLDSLLSVAEQSERDGLQPVLLKMATKYFS